MQAFTSHHKVRFLLRTPNIAAQPLLLVARVFLIVIGFTASSPAIAVNRAPEFRQFAATETNATGMAQVFFQTIAKGYRSGVRAPLQVVARSQIEWEKLWRQHSSIDATSPLPVVDFEKHIIVELFLGDKPTGGYEAEIIRAELSNADLVILYREKSPSKQAVVIQSLTQPFHIVQVTGAVNSGVIFRRSL